MSDPPSAGLPFKRDEPDDSDLIDALRLNLVPGIGPRLQQTLEAAFGTPSAILQASLAELQQVDGIGPKLAAAIVEHRNADAAIREIERCRQANIRLLRKAAPEYPRMLTQICDPPSVLYCRGRLDRGTRWPSPSSVHDVVRSMAGSRPSGLPARSRGQGRR